jgi:hypothetical protein
MRTPRRFSAAAGAALAVFLTASLTGVNARQNGGVAVGADDIGGTVTSAKGPEAGVWVIAETTELPTKFIKIVVTDDRGRYMLPDLPLANYTVWVRGYGLVDSAKQSARPGKSLNLTAVIAPSAKAAAEYYPANYWYSLLEPPPKTEFPGRGTGKDGNGIPTTIKTQNAWLANMKMTVGCTQCHQMGTKATREFPANFPKFKNSYEAWDYRVNVGVTGAMMNNSLQPMGRKRALEALASWTDRIAAGEVPQAPPRPQGQERNIVLTLWEVAEGNSMVHDVVSTDRRNPTVNANGPVYGVQEKSGDWMNVLDPIRHTDHRVFVEPHGKDLPYAWSVFAPNPSPYWHNEPIFKGVVFPHNPMIDGKGRVWITARGGCRVYDPKTEKMTHLAGCPGGHHLMLADDEKMWFDGGGVGYFDIAKWDQTGDDKASGGVIPLVLDINGNGVPDMPPVPADKPMDPTKDWAVGGGAYHVSPNPVDGSVWLSSIGIPGHITRTDPKTRLTEVYEPPYLNPARPDDEAHVPHGIDVDRATGVIWTGLNSGHFAAFDRRKCKAPLNGPKATGQHCPEGWTLHKTPGPNFKTVEGQGTSDSYYMNWVDWHNVSGLGTNIPILNGSGSDALHALVDGKWVTMRVPYPLSFMSRGVDGRIDDPKGGWKGRGLWSVYAQDTTWHQEGGKTQRPKVVKFQLRPNPLAN